VYWDESVGAWVLTRYADVSAAFRDPRLSAERVLLDAAWFPTEMRELVGPPIRTLAQQMIFSDPPDHTRLRGLWVKAFTPRQVEAVRARIQQLTDQLLSGVGASGQLDVMCDLAIPLHAIVIVEMLGVPAEDHGHFAAWTADYADLLDGKVRTRKGIARVLRSVSELMGYFRMLIAQRRIAPRDDLLQALITVEEQGAILSEEELLANCILLLVAGHESTAHLIGNGVLALLQHPDQLQALRDDPSLIAAAVTETLRYDSPVQAAARLAKQDLEIGSERIRAGQAIFMCLGAANRDPAQFAEPNRFDLHRPENRPLAFGHGIHICLGAPLARLQAQIALSTILRRFQTLRHAATPPEWEVGLSSRGLKSLPIMWV